jgi:pimeloyl-ACP methyl ester carboxylesterase
MEEIMASRRITNSTNVRFFMAALAAADRVAPSLAVELALRAFLAPPRAPRPDRERAVLAAAERSTVVAAGSAVRVWSWGDGPTVLLVHGWGGRGAQLGAFVPALTARGWRVVAFDAPAHGDSPGTRTTLAAIAEAVRGVAAHVGDLDGVIAHSFGAAATTVALARGLRARRVAYLAPLFLVADSVGRYLDGIGLSPRGRDQFRAELAAANLAGPEKLDGRALAPDLDLPLLVVHDEADREVPYRDAIAAAATWPGARLITTVGLGHRRILDDPHVIELVGDYLARGAATPARLDEAALIDRDLADPERRRVARFP